MVTIKNIRQKQGYSGTDHLLNDGPLEAMIGRTYRDVAAAKRAANNIQKDGECGGNGPISITLDVCGDEVKVSC